MIHITVNGSRLTAVTDEPLVAKTMGIVTFEIRFSEDWDDLEKTVVFSGKAATKPVLDLEEETEVPWEPLDQPGYLYISAVGRADGKRDVTALMDKPLRIVRNGDLGDNTTELPPTPTELEQAVLACARAAREAREAENSVANMTTETKINAELAVKAAEESKNSASASEKAMEAAQEAEKSASVSAAKAEAATSEKGWLYVEMREDGHLYLITENLDSLKLKLQEGRLKLIYE